MHVPARRLAVLVLATTAAALGVPAGVAVAAPVPTFAIAPLFVHPGQPVSFDGRGSTPSPGSDITAYGWSFGDRSAPATTALATHTFAAAGSYDVTLTVAETAPESLNAPPLVATATRTVVVTPAPHATLTSEATAGTTVTFGFAGALPGSTFTCALDRGPWSACVSPRAYANLTPGNHAFWVRELSAAGEPDLRPLVVAFTVAPPPPSPPTPTLPSLAAIAPLPAPAPVPVPIPVRPRTPSPSPPRVALPAPPGSPRHVHLGPANVITPDDVAVGARAGHVHGCADKNPNHPENVSHCGWPQITGMFFNTGDTRCDACPSSIRATLTIKGTGTLNDMLLGAFGDVTILAGDGDNVLWADRVPNGPTTQHARIVAGDGDNIVYAGPGTNVISVGRGKNLIHAWQGRGRITCASTRSVVRTMPRARKRYTFRGCRVTKGY